MNCSENHVSILNYCISPSVIILIVVAAVIALMLFVIWKRSRGRDEDNSLPATTSNAIPISTEENQPKSWVTVSDGNEDEEDKEEDDKDGDAEEQELKIGDTIMFIDWPMEITSVDDDDNNAYGALRVTLPPGAQFISLQRQHYESYSVTRTGFTIVYKPTGPVVATTIDYDPNPDYPPTYGDYRIGIDRIDILVAE